MESIDLVLFGFLEMIFAWTTDRFGRLAGWLVCLVAVGAVCGVLLAFVLWVFR